MSDYEVPYSAVSESLDQLVKTALASDLASDYNHCQLIDVIERLTELFEERLDDLAVIRKTSFGLITIRKQGTPDTQGWLSGDTEDI